MINNDALLVGQVIRDSFEIQFVICVSHLMLRLKVKSDSRKLLFSQPLLSFISGVSHKEVFQFTIGRKFLQKGEAACSVTSVLSIGCFLAWI